MILFVVVGVDDYEDGSGDSLWWLKIVSLSSFNIEYLMLWYSIINFN